MAYITAWESSGYSSSLPTISTTDVTDDTCVSNGTGCSTGYRNGQAISTSAGDLRYIITGTPTTNFNCIIGLQTTTTAASVSCQNLRASPPYVAIIRHNEAGSAIPNEDGASATTWTSGDIFDISISGTTASFKKNGVEWTTKTVSAGSYHAACCSYTGQSYTFQIKPAAEPSTGGVLLPPPYSEVVF